MLNKRGKEVGGRSKREREGWRGKKGKKERKEKERRGEGGVVE